MFGLILGQLVIAVLGALTITSEYSTGMIRTSLTVMPRRGTVYAAKAIVFTAVALVAGLVTSFGSYFIGQAIFATHHLNSSLGQPGVLRAVVGGGLFLAACGLLSYGIGALLRHTAAAITASVALLFVLFVLSGFLPSSWAVHVDKWLPFNAGGAIWENLSGATCSARGWGSGSSVPTPRSRSWRAGSCSAPGTRDPGPPGPGRVRDPARGGWRPDAGRAASHPSRPRSGLAARAPEGDPLGGVAALLGRA